MVLEAASCYWSTAGTGVLVGVDNSAFEVRMDTRDNERELDIANEIAQAVLSR